MSHNKGNRGTRSLLHNWPGGKLRRNTVLCFNKGVLPRVQGRKIIINKALSMVHADFKLFLFINCQFTSDEHARYKFECFCLK